MEMKCYGTGCPLRQSCERYSTPSIERQQYMMSRYSVAYAECTKFVPSSDPNASLPKTPCTFCEKMEYHHQLINHFGRLICKSCMKEQAKYVNPARRY